MSWLAPLFHYSGGIKYHLRALRYERHFWKFHQAQTEKFLIQWNPPRGALLLIGCSAGYSLPTAWLRSFDQITALEPDGLARILFEKRHGIKPVWIEGTLAFSGAGNATLEKAFEDHQSILFCNILGQLDLDETRGIQNLLETWTQGRSWASYHDVLSGQDFSYLPEAQSPQKISKRLISDLKKEIVPRAARGTLELNYHAAFDLFSPLKGRAFYYWEWEITPHQVNLIEGCFFNPDHS